MQRTQLADGTRVAGKDGWQGTLHLPAEPAGADAHVRVRLDSGRDVWVSPQALMLQQDGSYFLPLPLSELAAAAAPENPASGEDLVIQLLEEEISVRKRQVAGGGVRVGVRVHEREAVVDEPLLREEIQVERVAINRVVERPVPVRKEGETTIIPLLEEVLVVEKRLMLKEEVRITKRGYEAREPQRVVLRSEEATVESIEPEELEDGAVDTAPHRMHQGRS